MSKVGIIDCVKLVNGTKLMYDNKNLTSVKCPFPELKDGTQMFTGCSFLKTFEVTDLSKLENGHMMFYVDNTTEEDTFTTFSIDLPNLKNGYYMFGRAKNPFEVYGDGTVAQSNYPALKTFEGDLSNLVDGRWMFSNSSIKYFLPTSNLSNLKCGYNMFQHAYLMPESFEKLSDVLPDITDLMTTENLNDDSKWEYTVNNETKTIPLEMRGMLGLQCRRLDEENLPVVQKYLDKITDKGWRVVRNGGYLQNGNIRAEYNIPFYYSKTLKIEVQKELSDGTFSAVVDGDYTFSGTRNQGERGTIYFSSVINGSIPYVNIPPIIDEGEDVCLDDGTCGKSYMSIGFDRGSNSGCVVIFELSFVKSTLSVNCVHVGQNIYQKYHLFIDGNWVGET